MINLQLKENQLSQSTQFSWNPFLKHPYIVVKFYPQLTFHFPCFILVMTYIIITENEKLLRTKIMEIQNIMYQ